MTSENEGLEPSLQAFVGRMGLMFEKRAAPGMAGRILAYLLVASDDVQSSAAIAKALTTTSGSVSINTRMLEQMGLIERISLPGRRGAFFRARPDAWDTMFSAQIEEVREFRQAFDSALQALNDRKPSRVRRLSVVREFYAFLEEELPALVERWRRRMERAREDE